MSRLARLVVYIGVMASFGFGVPAFAQNRPLTGSTLTLTDTTVDSLHVGCAVGSSACTGGIKAGVATIATLTTTTFSTATLTASGTASVTGDFAVNTNKFNVTASSGNTAVAGTLAVVGDVAVNTNKFNVTAASGNTLVAGTLGVTGTSTLGVVTATTATVSTALSVTGVPSSTGAYRFAGTASALLSVPVGSTLIAWDGTEEVDTGGLHSTTVNPARINVPSTGAGFWIFGVSGLTVDAGVSGAGSVGIHITKNGVLLTPYCSVGVPNQSSGPIPIMSVACAAQLANSDYIEVVADNASGGTINFYPNGARYWAVRVW